MPHTHGGRTRSEIHEAIARTQKAKSHIEDAIDLLKAERNAYKRQLVELLHELDRTPAPTIPVT